MRGRFHYVIMPRVGTWLLIFALLGSKGLGAEGRPGFRRPPLTLLERIQRLVHRMPSIYPAGCRIVTARRICLISPHVHGLRLREGVLAAEALVHWRNERIRRLRERV